MTKKELIEAVKEASENAINSDVDMFPLDVIRMIVNRCTQHMSKDGLNELKSIFDGWAKNEPF